jgi:hypothetical protein
MDFWAVEGMKKGFLFLYKQSQSTAPGILYGKMIRI